VTINQTRINRPGPEPVGVEVDDSWYEGDVEMYFPGRARSFWRGP
jgi:hypothetical protein